MNLTAKAIRRYFPVAIAALLSLGAILSQTRYTTAGSPVITTPRMKKILDEGQMIIGWAEAMKDSFVADPTFVKRQPSARALLATEAKERFMGVLQSVVVKGPQMDPYWGQSMALLRQTLLEAEKYHGNVARFIELDLQGLPYLMSAVRSREQINGRLDRIGGFTRTQLDKLTTEKKGY